MGLIDPRTGRRPWAAVQLRQENLRADSYNLVGFQNHLRFAEQKRIMRLIPGLENAEFLRYGQIHRNTYINAPALLNSTLQLRDHPNVFFAGQISGVEGYVESIATGMAAGMLLANYLKSEPSRPFPRESAIGSLLHYISHADPKHYQPANIAFDLFPATENPSRDRRERQITICNLAAAKFEEYVRTQ
jgi:methylenetetrahydrofolate--tRNA-(uracil-5-)-methyltransferase